MFEDKSLQHFALIVKPNPCQCITLPLFSVEGLESASLGITWYGVLSQSSAGNYAY